MNMIVFFWQFIAMSHHMIQFFRQRKIRNFLLALCQFFLQIHINLLAQYIRIQFIAKQHGFLFLECLQALFYLIQFSPGCQRKRLCRRLHLLGKTDDSHQTDGFHDFCLFFCQILFEYHHRLAPLQMTSTVPEIPL